MDPDPRVRMNAIAKLDPADSGVQQCLKNLAVLDQDPNVRIVALNKLDPR